MSIDSAFARLRTAVARCSRLPYDDIVNAVDHLAKRVDRLTTELVLARAVADPLAALLDRTYPGTEQFPNTGYSAQPGYEFYEWIHEADVGDDTIRAIEAWHRYRKAQP